MAGMPEDRRSQIARTAQEHLGENAARWEEAFEEERVKFVLARCGIADRKWTLLNAAKAAYGRPRLTFRLFNEAFPTFPVFLGASRLGGVKLHEDPKSSLPEWFNHFDRTPFFKAYEEFYEQAAPAAGTRAVGLVFPRNRVRGGLVIHDGGLDDYFVHGTVVTYTGGTKEKPFRLHVQPFNSLVDAIHHRGHGWKPGD